jgi:hypothetical protein
MLLLFLTSSLFLVCGCSAIEEYVIHKAPVSQVVKLGESATFHCSASSSASGSFEWVIYTTYRDPIYAADYTSLPDGMTKYIAAIYNEERHIITYTAGFTIEGSYKFNSTILACRVFGYGGSMSDSLFSDKALLTVIGPPNTPSALTLPGQGVDMEQRRFSAVWNVPFSHGNHSVSLYTVSVSNSNQSESYQEWVGPETQAPGSGVVHTTLPFPNHTASCDILNISVSASNDIGASKPAYANMYIPKVPDTEVMAKTTVHSDSRNNITILIEIKVCCMHDLLRLLVLTVPGPVLV